MYKLTCPDCHKGYVGQTGCQFSYRYKEHKTAWHNQNTTSNVAQQLTEEGHSFGPMNQIMEIIHCHKKGAYLNTLERFHIHTESIKNNQLSDPETIHPNAIFYTLTKDDRPTDRPLDHRDSPPHSDYCGSLNTERTRPFHTKPHSALIAAERTTTQKELENTHNKKPAPPTHIRHVYVRLIYI